MAAIIEDCKRGLATLYLGEDLSTLSRAGQGVGASVQGEDRARRERSDCARVQETLNATVDAAVLRWFFGEDARGARAQLVIDVPVFEDRAMLGNLCAVDGQPRRARAGGGSRASAPRADGASGRPRLPGPGENPPRRSSEPAAGTLAAFNVADRGVIFS